jgi:hypothetical protein
VDIFEHNGRSWKLSERHGRFSIEFEDDNGFTSIPAHPLMIEVFARHILTADVPTTIQDHRQNVIPLRRKIG